MLPNLSGCNHFKGHTGQEEQVFSQVFWWGIGGDDQRRLPKLSLTLTRGVSKVKVEDGKWVSLAVRTSWITIHSGLGEQYKGFAFVGVSIWVGMKESKGENEAGEKGRIKFKELRNEF